MTAVALEDVGYVETRPEQAWMTVCESADLPPNLGVRALVAGAQVALFRVQSRVYAISAIDPFTKAAVLSRGIVGELRGRLVVASPLYKQHFELATGVCLEDESVRVTTYAVQEASGRVRVAIQ